MLSGITSYWQYKLFFVCLIFKPFKSNVLMEGHAEVDPNFTVKYYEKLKYDWYVFDKQVFPHNIKFS